MTNKVLVIEDQLELANLVKLHLTDIDCRVKLEFDGLAGRAEAEKNKYDLIILDLNLPRLTGLELLAQSRPERGTIVVFSSSTIDEERIRAAHLGAKEFVTKPSTYEAYVEAVCGIIERWAVRR